MEKEITPIMIIGSAKSGTSTLYSHLIKHPEICEGVIKEPEYFTSRGNEKYKQGDYYKLFNIDTAIHRFTIDGSTGYSMCHNEKKVPQKMKDYGMNPFIIYIIRNPFDRIRSHYNFNTKNPKWKLEIDSPHLINTTMYFQQLEEYKKVFGEKRILLLDFEDLKTDPEGVCNRIFKFIGVHNNNIKIKNEVKNITQPHNKKRDKFIYKLKSLKIGKIFPSFLNSSIEKTIIKLFPGKQDFLTENQKKDIKNK